MNESGIQRINELYHKAKTEGLSAQEAAEQKELRARFIADIKANVRSQLDNVSIVEPDGSITNVGENRCDKAGS